MEQAVWNPFGVSGRVRGNARSVWTAAASAPLSGPCGQRARPKAVLKSSPSRRFATSLLAGRFSASFRGRNLHLCPAQIFGSVWLAADVGVRAPSAGTIRLEPQRHEEHEGQAGKADGCAGEHHTPDGGTGIVGLGPTLRQSFVFFVSFVVQIDCMAPVQLHPLPLPVGDFLAEARRR